MLENFGDEHGLGRAAKRTTSAEHLVHHDAESVEIGARRRVAAAQNFGRHVGERSGNARFQILSRVFRRRGDLQCQSEIHHLHMTARREHHVRALHIAMHDAARMRRFERFRDLERVTHD